MRMNSSLGKLAFLASLLVLFAVSMVGADVVPESSLETPQASTCGEVEACGAQPTGELLPTTPAWMSETSGVCEYTCPMNLVQLCPEISGYTVTCNNGCCVYC